MRGEGPSQPPPLSADNAQVQTTDSAAAHDTETGNTAPEDTDQPTNQPATGATVPSVTNQPATGATVPSALRASRQLPTIHRHWSRTNNPSKRRNSA
jgi:hypothetical protein